MSITATPLQLHQQRFMVSPCGYLADYFHASEIAIKAPTWTDCTDMDDAELNQLMVRRMQAAQLPEAA